MLKLRMSLPPTANHRLLPVKAGKGVRMVKAPKYREWLNSAVAALKEQAAYVYADDEDAMQLGIVMGTPSAKDVMEHGVLPYAKTALSTKPPVTEPVTALTVVHFPNNRRCDLDNVLKGANDALVKAGVIADDSLITTQIAQRGANAEGGLVEVYICLRNSMEDIEIQAALFKHMF